MHKRSRRSPAVLPLITILAVAVALGACRTTDPTASTAPSAQPSAAPSALASADASASAASGEAASQTDTEWGRIWDEVPSEFPTVPGSTPADDAGPDPVSATYAVAGGDPAEIAEWMQSALEMASFRTESRSGPLENQGYILESAGQDGCRIQVAVTPMGGLVFVAVRYGAACPPG